jgi:hypothetical protein
MHFLMFLLFALALVVRPFAEAASSLAYCATDNTGSSFSAGMCDMNILLERHSLLTWTFSTFSF